MEEFGYRIIFGLQGLDTPALQVVARGASFLGDEPFYLLLIPVLYWAVHRGTGLRLTILFLFSAWLNATLKGWVDLPRPSPDRVTVLLDEVTGGVPSGHAQNALVVWGYLAWTLRTRLGGTGDGPDDPRRKVLVPIAATLVLLIGWSRLHLGVHFPHDLVTGWLVGLILLAGWIRMEARFDRQLSTRPGGAGLAAAGLPPALIWIHRSYNALPAAATLWGAGIGAWWERRNLRFTSSGPLWKRGLRMLAGLPVALGIWLGLTGLPLPSEELARGLRYFLLGLWLTAGAPLLFVVLGLSERSPPQEAPFAPGPPETPVVPVDPVDPEAPDEGVVSDEAGGR